MNKIGILNNMMRKIVAAIVGVSIFYFFDIFLTDQFIAHHFLISLLTSKNVIKMSLFIFTFLTLLPFLCSNLVSSFLGAAVGTVVLKEFNIYLISLPIVILNSVPFIMSLFANVPTFDLSVVLAINLFLTFCSCLCGILIANKYNLR